MDPALQERHGSDFFLLALVVKDTLADPVFDDHALRHVFRCYISCPISPPRTNLYVGALCCVDDEPHNNLPMDWVNHVRILAAMAANMLPTR